MISEDEILKGIQNVFNEVFVDKIDVTRDLSADDVVEWDSITQLTIVILVESRFAIRFRLGEVSTTKNIGEFSDLILKRLLEKNVLQGS